MHFPIIKLEPIDVPSEDWCTDLSYEDSVLNENTDYYGELYNDEDRRNVITSEWLEELLDGIATIDKKKETITFLDKDTIKRTLNAYYSELTSELHDKAESGNLEAYDLRRASKKFRDDETLFYIDWGFTSLDFAEEAMYRAGETYKFGNIFDAHF